MGNISVVLFSLDRFFHNMFSLVVGEESAWFLYTYTDQKANVGEE